MLTRLRRKVESGRTTEGDRAISNDLSAFARRKIAVQDFTFPLHGEPDRNYSVAELSSENSERIQSVTANPKPLQRLAHSI